VDLYFAGLFQMCDVVEISDDEVELPKFPLGQLVLDNHVSTASSESSQEDVYTSQANSQDYVVSSADRRKVLGDYYQLIVFYHDVQAEREARRKEKEERKAFREQQRLEKKQRKAKEKATEKAIKEVGINKPDNAYDYMQCYLPNMIISVTKVYTGYYYLRYSSQPIKRLDQERGSNTWCYILIMD